MLSLQSHCVSINAWDPWDYLTLLDVVPALESFLMPSEFCWFTPLLLTVSASPRAPFKTRAIWLSDFYFFFFILQASELYYNFPLSPPVCASRQNKCVFRTQVVTQSSGQAPPPFSTSAVLLSLDENPPETSAGKYSHETSLYFLTFPCLVKLLCVLVLFAVPFLCCQTARRWQYRPRDFSNLIIKEHLTLIPLLEMQWNDESENHVMKE